MSGKSGKASAYRSVVVVSRSSSWDSCQRLMLIFPTAKEARVHVCLSVIGFCFIKPIVQLTHIRIPKDHPWENVSSTLARQDVPGGPAEQPPSWPVREYTCLAVNGG